MLFRSPRSRSTFPEGWVLRVQSGPGAPEVLPLASPQLDIGRDPGCQLCLPDDQRISRRHARLTYEDGEWLVEDLGSANGTFAGRERVLRITPLSPGDRIMVGHTCLVLDSPGNPPGLNMEQAGFDGLETEVGDRDGYGASDLAREVDAALAGVLANLETEVETEEHHAPEPPPAEPEPLAEEPAVEESTPLTEPGKPVREEPAPLPAAGPVAAAGDDFLQELRRSAGSRAEGSPHLEWAPGGLGARMQFPDLDSASSGPLHAALHGLRPPEGISPTLTEVLGEPGLCLQLQATPGTQPQLLLCAGEIIDRLTRASVCAEVLLPASA